MSTSAVQPSKPTVLQRLGLSSEPIPNPPVKIRVDVPQPVFDQYKKSADAVGRDVEEFIGDHLRQTVKQDHTGAGLWFTAEQARRLCQLTGRGSCNDAQLIIDRLSPLMEVLVGDVIVELDAQILDRLKHIRKHITPQEFVRKEALNGVRVSLGLSPK